MEITAKLKPRKLEPVSPINVFAGLKLNGKNPKIAPANAVVKIIANNGEPLSANIIINETHDTRDIPEDNPSSPSIKFIALVTPIIQHTVIIYEKTSFNSPERNGRFMFSIRIPAKHTINADIICTHNFTIAVTPLESSIKHVIPNKRIPTKNPANLV